MGCKFQLALSLMWIGSLASANSNPYLAISTPNTIPYEVCSSDKKQISEDLINFNSESLKKSESDYCYNCQSRINGRVRSLNEISDVSNQIPKTCFLLSNLRGVYASSNPKRYYYCGKLNQSDNLLDKKPLLNEKINRSPCLNEKYVDMTYKSFHKMTKCFQFNLKEKESAFQLMNHESGFLLNAKSPSAARCYGQITRKAINHILHSVEEKKEIYKNFKSTCPEINYPVDLKRLLELSDKSINKKLSAEDRYTGAKHINCQVTQDPYSCLFYSLFYFKMNLESAKAEIEKESEKITKDMLKKDPGLSTFYSENPQIKLPVKVSEVIVVKGTATSIKTQNKLNIKWIFKDSISAYKNLKKLKDKKLSIQKVTLFDSKTLTARIAQWSHNGGGSIATSYFPKELRKFKNFMTNPPKPENYSGSNARYCNNNSKKEFCIYRNSLFTNNKPLSFSKFSRRFESYLNLNYKTDPEWTEKKSKDRRSEVSKFLKHINENFESIQNPKTVKEKLNKLRKRDNRYFQGDFDKFSDNLNNYCQFSDSTVLE